MHEVAIVDRNSECLANGQLQLWSGLCNVGWSLIQQRAKGLGRVEEVARDNTEVQYSTNLMCILRCMKELEFEAHAEWNIGVDDLREYWKRRMPVVRNTK